MKGHFPNSADVTVWTKQNTWENWMGDNSLQAPHTLKAGSWTLCPCKPWLQNHKQHSRHVTNGFLIFPHKHFTCKYEAVEITLRKWFDPLSLRIYIFYNPFFMLSNSYLIPFSPFHRLYITGERADRNRAQMWACREGSGQLHSGATWGTNTILDSTGVLNLGLLRFYKTTQSTLCPLPFEIMLPI